MFFEVLSVIIIFRDSLLFGNHLHKYFSLVILFALISGNSVISAHQKNKFQTTGAIIFVICIMEVLTIIFNDTPVKFRFFHKSSNFIGFSLTPLVYVSLSKALFPHIGEKHFKINPIVVLFGIYPLWLFVSLIVSPKYSVFSLMIKIITRVRADFLSTWLFT